MIYRARILVLDADTFIPDGALRIRDGRVAAAGPWNPRRRPGGPVRDLGDVAILPGLVNAHTHLELSDLAGRLRSRRPFDVWIQGLRDEIRTWSRIDFRASLHRGIRRSLAAGTTAVGDICSRTYLLPDLFRTPLCGVVYAEMLHPNPAHAAAGLAEARDLLRRHARSRGSLRLGLSPHAPYTVSTALFRGLARLTLARRLPLAIHAAESKQERRFVRRGDGPLADLLRRYGRKLPFARPPGTTPVAYLARLGLLRPGTTLIHANYLTPDDVGRIARSGAAVVFCPGSHAFFGHDPHPVRRLLKAGVPVALGTDSLASNAELSIPREMRLLIAGYGIPPRDAFRMATEHGARALGMAGRMGVLRPGARADFLAVEVPGGLGKGEPWEIFGQEFTIQKSWIAGHGLQLTH